MKIIRNIRIPKEIIYPKIAFAYKDKFLRGLGFDPARCDVVTYHCDGKDQIRQIEVDITRALVFKRFSL